MTTKTILEEAYEVINGPRRSSYGDAKKSFERIAVMWSDILKIEVTPQQVGLCMIALKLCRESNSHSRDNLVDICGYAALIENLTPPPTP